MTITDRSTCRHPSCGCEPEPDFEPWCSIYCGNVAEQDEPTGACSCGHAGCTRSTKKSTATPHPVSMGPGPGSQSAA